MSEALQADRPPPKAPAPDLNGRAPRPSAVRLRASVVRIAVLGAGTVVAGSLAWAFVIQPELRAEALERAAQDRPAEANGAVRPTEMVTDQPSSYDRLPEPRMAGDAARGEHAEGAVQAPSSARVEPVYPSGRAVAAPTRPAGAAVADQAAGSGLFFDPPLGRAPTAPPPQAARETRTVGFVPADHGAIYNLHGLVEPLSPFELKAGAIVPAALLTGIDTARAGPVVAIVTQNVFDTVSGRHLLVPQGTRLIGRHDGETAYGDRRAFLTWERLILPNGKSLILANEPGVDAQGAVGVRGQADRRLVPLAVATLFGAAITTLGQIARDDDDRSGGLLGDVGDAAAIEGAQTGGRLIDRELQVRPSIRLRAGAPVRVMITRDIILEPYAP